MILAGLAVPVIARQTQGGRGMMGGKMGGIDKTIQAFDTNADGTLSAYEMKAGIAGQITTYDTDNNGALSLAESQAFFAAHARPMTVRAFQMHDADGEGQVTAQEMADLPGPIANTNGPMD